MKEPRADTAGGPARATGSDHRTHSGSAAVAITGTHEETSSQYQTIAWRFGRRYRPVSPQSTHPARLLWKFGSEPPRMPNIGSTGTRPYADGELIGRDRRYGEIVCFCERVSRGEIRDALRGDLPAADPRGVAAQDPGGHGPLPGLLLRGGRHPPAERRRRRPPARGDPPVNARDEDPMDRYRSGTTWTSPWSAVGPVAWPPPSPCASRRVRRRGAGARIRRRRHTTAQRAHRLRAARPAPR